MIENPRIKPDSENLQVLYVGKHGSDTSDGETWDRAFLTFGAAIAAAGTPANEAAAVTVTCFDDGTYSEAIDTPEWVNIFAPDAVINPGAGSFHRIRDNCRWFIGSINADQYAVWKSHSDTGQSYFRCRRISRTSINNQPIWCAGGILVISVDHMTGTGGIVSCVADTAGVDATITGSVGRVDASAASTGITCSSSNTGNAVVNLIIGEIEYDTGLSATLASAFTTSTGQARITLYFGSMVGDSLTGFATFTASTGARSIHAVGAYMEVQIPVQTFSAGDEVNLVCSKINGGTNSITNGSIVRITEARRDGSGAGAPGINDDENDGYSLFSMYYDTAGADMYVCCDASAGAAVWKQTTP